jgi:hypothetical protein
VISRFICAALFTASLCGCAYVKTDVNAVDLSDALAGERTYALAQAPSQESDPDGARTQVIVREELAKDGFVTAPNDRARYLLLTSFGTRLATIGTYSGDCKLDSDGCQSDEASPGFHLFGGSQYRHSLTLRFLDRKTGQPMYKVTATYLDRNADPYHGTEYLVRSALARFAHGGQENWQVQLHTVDSGGVPIVVSIKPRER